MISPEEARRTARDRLAARLVHWAVTRPPVPALSIALHPPSERVALADQDAARGWARAWAGADLPDGAELEWKEPEWRRLGRQSLPVRLRLPRPDHVAAFAGGAVARDWRSVAKRVDAVRSTFTDAAAVDQVLRRHGSAILKLDPGRFDQVLAVTSWLVHHPARGLRPRQVPIRGVDTKWLAAHRSLVTDLHAAATGEADLGLVDSDRLLRMRILDPSQAPGVPRDLATPVSEMPRLALSPAAVIVLENLETLLSLPTWPGVVAVHGSGYAVDTLGALPWLTGVPIVYWGDLDSHGFAILNRVRQHLPQARSTLMDEATLLAHRDLWVAEPRPSRGSFDRLTAEESASLTRLRREGDVRLEQERIPWEVALAALQEALRPQR